MLCWRSHGTGWVRVLYLCCAAGAGVALQALEVRGHVAGRLVAQARIFFEGLGDDAVELLRQRRIQTRGRNRLALENRSKNYASGVSGKCLAAGGHFVEDEAKGKKIGAAIEFFSARLFGR